jgi:predicted RNA-binding protein with PUA-like domain
MAHWLVKSEPSAYSYAQLESDGRTAWTGVRNFEARNNLRAMAVGDVCLYYHSGPEKAVVGVAAVVKASYPDPTAKEEAKQADWSAVDLTPERRLRYPVTLAAVKGVPELSKMALVRKSRLSVTPVTEREFKKVLWLGERGSV